MLTEEEKKKRDKLVKERPCKECIHHRKTQYLSCGYKCDYSHSGFQRIKPNAKDI